MYFCQLKNILALSFLLVRRTLGENICLSWLKFNLSRAPGQVIFLPLGRYLIGAKCCFKHPRTWFCGALSLCLCVCLSAYTSGTLTILSASILECLVPGIGHDTSPYDCIQTESQPVVLRSIDVERHTGIQNYSFVNVLGLT